MTRVAELLNTMTLLRDFPQHGVMRGDIGGGRRPGEFCRAARRLSRDPQMR